MSATRIVDVRAGFAHCQIVAGDGGEVVVIDPGRAGPVLDALARERIPLTSVRWIVLTHGDGDHWGGAAALVERSGAQVAAHEAERAYLDGTRMPPFSLPKRLLIGLGGRRAVPPRVDRWLRDGETVGRLEVIHTPGHTPGHICLQAGTDLIAGDAFTTGERFSEVPRLMSADAAGARRAIRALAGREISRAFSGHGPPADDAAGRLRELVARLPAA